MLLQINIVNFALIEKLSVNFHKGFNVLSGETGAGKSILIDAINYVLGGKFNKDYIRTGEKKTYVEAIFTLENYGVLSPLKEMDLEIDDYIIISRETFQSGKSIVKVNGRSMLLSDLKKISSKLIDIHGQHQNQNLLNESNHIYYLDFYGKAILENKLSIYKQKYEELKQLEYKINQLVFKEGEREKLIDFLKFQLNEIDNAKLKLGEDKELENEFTVLSNSEKINNTLLNCYQILNCGNENEKSVFDNIGAVTKELKYIQKYDNNIEKIVVSLEEIYYGIEQNVNDIRNIKDKLYYDENTLNYINERLYIINNLKKKYGDSIEKILEYREKIYIQSNELENLSSNLKKLEENKNTILCELEELSLDIHKNRIEISKQLEIKIKNELNYIGLEKATFKIEVQNLNYFNENGKDRIQFLISTNQGEPMKSLQKIVSGGELSRIMLALKTVFINQDKIPTVIFDEIDTGISGRIAQCVAEKMYLISLEHQVFCVTHLSQIAAMSEHHYKVYKQIANGKTFTVVQELNSIEKDEEIAKMISGVEVTKLSMDNAKEMISLAKVIKENIDKTTM